MAHHDVYSLANAQMPSQLLGQVDRAMLPSRTSERNRESLEPAVQVVTYTRIDQGYDIREELMYRFLLLKVLGDCSFLSGKLFESLFAARVRQAAGIENKAAPMSRFVLWQPAM